ncbi:hypothetical protein SDC9_155021 [bioreactor metagenome]|uniref:Uncharacterized protein n=1 Tax=bioreactor metagenome TaxID=1076179 RepID=A0A645F2V9_9ZZZZ
MSPLQKNTLHLVQIIFQAVQVPFKKARAKHYFEHVSLKFHSGANLESARALKNLDIHVFPDNLNDFRHQIRTIKVDIGNFVLRNRTIYFHYYQIGNDTLYYSFCHI